jgi:hypothetical protein
MIGELFTPSQVDGLSRDDSRQGPLGTALVWMRNYLANPDPRVGHDGPVCPFVPLGLTKDTLWLAVDSATTPAEVEATMLEYADEFERRTEGFGTDVQFASIIVVFRRVGAREAPAAIDAVQRRLKVRFVERGLMIGEFHQANETPPASPDAVPGTFPNRAPVSMLAIRALVRNDRKFLTGEGFSVPDRLRLKRGFMRAQYRATANTAWRETLDWVISELDGLIETLEEST